MPIGAPSPSCLPGDVGRHLAPGLPGQVWGGPVESVPALPVDAVPVSIPLSVSLCSHLLCTAASGGQGVLTVVAHQIADRVRAGSYLPIECAFTMANLPDRRPLG